MQVYFKKYLHKLSYKCIIIKNNCILTFAIDRRKRMIKVGIVGATGYVGEELVRILMQHPQSKIINLTSQSYVGKSYNEIYQNFEEICAHICEEEDIEKLSKEADVIFLALPHGIASKKVNASILTNTKIIDLGADFRLKNVGVYEQWYHSKHFSPELLEEAVYGLCEIKREQIKKSNLIANPGCYTTCSILSLYPLLKENLIDEESIVVDAKSGVSGAGRALSLGTHYIECTESIKAYKIASHRHTPEIEQELGEAYQKEIKISFTPHLVPMNRGILATCYGKLKKQISWEDVMNIYKKYYEKEQFIRLMRKDVYPETRWVKGSNYCDIGFSLDERTGRIIVIGAIDNLVKGAAGQAVQNMNILFGLEENTGLNQIPMFP